MFIHSSIHSTPRLHLFSAFTVFCVCLPFIVTSRQIKTRNDGLLLQVHPYLSRKVLYDLCAENKYKQHHNPCESFIWWKTSDLQIDKICFFFFVFKVKLTNTMDQTIFNYFISWLWWVCMKEVMHLSHYYEQKKLLKTFNSFQKATSCPYRYSWSKFGTLIHIWDTNKCKWTSDLLRAHILLADKRNARPKKVYICSFFKRQGKISKRLGCALNNCVYIITLSWDLKVVALSVHLFVFSNKQDRGAFTTLSLKGKLKNNAFCFFHKVTGGDFIDMKQPHYPRSPACPSSFFFVLLLSWCFFDVRELILLQFHYAFIFFFGGVFPRQ